MYINYIFDVKYTSLLNLLCLFVNFQYIHDLFTRIIISSFLLLILIITFFTYIHTFAVNKNSGAVDDGSKTLQSLSLLLSIIKIEPPYVYLFCLFCFVYSFIN